VPFDPAALKALADGGGLVLFLALVVMIAITLFRGTWVPGSYYREVSAERDALRVELKVLSRTVERLTVQLARERRVRSADHPDA
jgi:hypothetical protein